MLYQGRAYWSLETRPSSWRHWCRHSSTCWVRFSAQCLKTTPRCRLLEGKLSEWKHWPQKLHKVWLQDYITLISIVLPGKRIAHWCVISKGIHCRAMLVLHAKECTLLNVVCVRTNVASSGFEWTSMVFYTVSVIEMEPPGTMRASMCATVKFSWHILFSDQGPIS